MEMKTQGINLEFKKNLIEMQKPTAHSSFVEILVLGHHVLEISGGQQAIIALLGKHHTGTTKIHENKSQIINVNFEKQA